MRATLATLLVCLAGMAAAAEQQSPGDQFAIAIERNDLKKVQALVEGGNPADTSIDYGENHVTPLFKAAGEGRNDIVQYLVSKGANVNFKTADFGQTPLSEAVNRGFEDTVDLLLKAGADPKLTDRSGYPAFALAVLGGQYEIAETLLKAGGDVNGADSYGNTYLMACATTGNPTAMRWLVSHGADVNRVSQLQYGGNTALTSAAMVGQPDSIRTLLELGANAHLKMKDGSTALSKAQESKNAEAVALIQAALAKPAPPAAPARKPVTKTKS